MIRGGLRTNWFKASLLAIGVVALLATAHHQEQERNHRSMVECRSLGEKIEKEINPPNSPLPQHPENPEYYYNPRLKRCFYCGGHTEFIIKVKTMFLIDAYTNKEVASYSINYPISSPSEFKAETSFNMIKRELYR